MSADRRALLALIGLALATLVVFVDRNFQSMWDAVLYVLTTRSLLAGEGYAVYGEPFTLRPPGFSLMLAPVMALGGDHGWLALNLFTSALGIVAIALLFVLLRARLGLSVAFAACFGLWISPQFQGICQVTLSDGAGLAALFACLLVDRRARRTGTLSWDLALGLSIGIALYLRTVAILLIPAIVVSRLVEAWRTRRRRAADGAEPGGADEPAPAARPIARALVRSAWIAGVPLLLLWPWSLWKAQHEATGPTELWGIHSYSVAQWHEDPADPESARLGTDELLQRAPIRVRQCLTALGSRLPKLDLPGPLKVPEAQRLRAANRRFGGFAFGVLGVLCLLVRGLRRFEAGDVFALGNLAVLAIYFDFDERVLLPSYVFVLAATLEAITAALRRFLSRARARAVVALLFGAVALQDAYPGYDRGPAERETRVLSEVAEWLERTRPDDVPIGASLGHRLAAFLDRPVRFLEVAIARKGRQGFWRLVAKHRLRIVVHTGEHNYRLRTQLEAALADERLVHRVEDVRIYAIGPGED